MGDVHLSNAIRPSCLTRNQYHDVPVQDAKLRAPDATLHVVGFLDSYFKGIRVQYDPKNSEKVMLHQT